MLDVAAANASLDALTEADAAIARLCARRAEHLMTLIGLVGPEGAEGDIAGTLLLTRTGAARRAEIAVQLTSLPHLLQVMHAGLVDEYRVLVAYDEMIRVMEASDERWDPVDRVVASVAAGLDAGQLRKYVQKLMIELDPDKAHEENLKAKQRRQIRRYARAHGMSALVVDLSAEDAAVVMAVLNATADLVPKDDPRSRDQVMADCFVEVFKALGDGRAMRLVPVPAPTPPRDPAEPDYSRIPEQWMHPDDHEDAHDTGTATSTRTGTRTRDAGRADDATGTATAAMGESPPCESPSDLPGFVPDLWHPPALGTHQGERVRVVLHIEAETLLGRNDLATYLVGHGYITARAGRDLTRQCDSLDLVVQPFPHHERTAPDPDDHPRDPDDPGPDDPDPGPPESGPGRPGGVSSGPPGEPSRGQPRDGEDLLRDSDSDQRHRAPRVRTGHVHDPHHDEYRPRRALARRVMARNPHCRAPGCSRPAAQCDLDHCLEWPRGITCDCNLLPLCRFHHNLKTTGHWGYVMHPDGSITWTTRLGRRYRQPPPGPVGP